MLTLLFVSGIEDSVFVRKPNKLPYYAMIGSSALSAIMFGTGTVMALSSEDAQGQLIGGILLSLGAFLFASSTTIARFVYGEYVGGAVSCCIKSASCAILIGSSYIKREDESFDPLSAAAFSVSSLGCASASIYDAMNVHNMANMKVKVVEIVRIDTVYDTVKTVEKDTVVVVKVVKKLKRRRYRRKITPKDRERALREYNAGLEAFAQDRLEDALMHFQRASEYDPTFVKAREAARRVRNRLGR